MPRSHSAGGLVYSLALLALSGCAELPGRPGGAPPPGFMASQRGPQVQAVGVLIARWHTGLVLPATELGPLRALLRYDPTARYLSIGWGNRRFYTAAHPNSGDALAALLPSRSVLLVQGLAGAADAAPADGRLEWVCADRGELWRLAAYVHDSLQWQSGRPANGAASGAASGPSEVPVLWPVELGAGLLPESRFYASSAHYDAFHTCNTWTLAALQYAGLHVSAAGVLFAGQVGRRIRHLPMCPLLS